MILSFLDIIGRLNFPTPLELEMAIECKRHGDTRYELAIADFSAYLRKIADGQREIQPPGRVPGTEYWLEDNSRILGVARLRFRMVPEQEREGGHVGYDVRPSESYVPCGPKNKTGGRPGRQNSKERFS